MSAYSFALGLSFALSASALAWPAYAQTSGASPEADRAGAGTAAQEGSVPEAPVVPAAASQDPAANAVVGEGSADVTPLHQEGKLALAAGAGGTAAPATGEETPGNAGEAETSSDVLPASTASTEVPEWTRHVSIGGGVIVYYYQPTKGDAKNDVSVFFANLVLDGRWGQFGLHIEPRFRDTKLRPFFDGPAWLQEAYGSFTLDPVTIKVGKIYKRSGLFWDNSFYGNVQVYDGLKLDPNYGASVEGSVGGGWGLGFSVQYFVIDGRTNVSLVGRDTISIPGAYRRNTVVGRVEPFVKFGANDAGVLRLGGTAELFTAQLPTEDENVSRFAADGKLTYDTESYGAFGVWGEFLHQDGRHVTDFPVAGDPDATPPVAGRASGSNSYFEVGGEYTYWRLTARYNLSYASYEDVDVKEILHVPALGVKLNEHLGLLGEYVIWDRETKAGDVEMDRSLNVTLNGHF
jgi:hypothetical protein